ncbi:MAG: hypothetical protein NVSMB63_15660 [Sediminibacterium sp.]
MTVFLNNKPEDLRAHLSLSQALQAFGITSTKGIAVAVNNQVVKKEDWDTCFLQLHDAVMLIRASQGG